MQRVYSYSTATPTSQPPLGASAVLTGPWLSVAVFSLAQPLQMAAQSGVGGQPILSGSVYSDHAGSLVLQQSDNPSSTNFTDVLSTTAVTAATLLTITPVDVTALYWRFVYTNGGTAQTTFGLFLNLVS
jgi:hypothetical protein